MTRCMRWLLGATATIATTVSTLPVAYAEVPPPTVTSVCRVGIHEPECRMGPTSGGYRVRIRGTNLSGATAVWFGPYEARPMPNGSSTEIIAKAPPSMSNKGVRVQVTANGQTSSAECRSWFLRLQRGCDDAFYYSNTTPFGAKGRLPTFTVPAPEPISGSISLGSWSLTGRRQYSHGTFPQAFLAHLQLSVKHLAIHLSLAGGATIEQDIPIPVEGLPFFASLVLHLEIKVEGAATFDDVIVSDTLGVDGGWVNGGEVFKVSRSCRQRDCLGTPHFTAQAGGSLIVGAWLRAGAHGFNVAAGPVAGFAVDASGGHDICAGVQGRLQVPTDPLALADLLAPINLSGRFLDCPL